MKMLGFKILLLCFCSTASFGQDLNTVDRKVKRYPAFRSVSELGYRIQNDFATDSERVRAAFIWVTHNMHYGYALDKTFRTRSEAAYNFPTSQESVIRSLVKAKVDLAFNTKKGVCIDYSLLLHTLFEHFGLGSKVITGVAKTEIKNFRGQELFKDHSWNAVRIDGEWKLLDATWASGIVDSKSKRFYKLFEDHYFFTKPDEFVKHHLPVNSEWQLLKDPVDPQTFFRAPIFFPDYFDKGVQLSSETDGILSLSDPEENYLYFDGLPKIHGMYYTIDGSKEFKRLGLKKKTKGAYISKIRLNRRLKRNYRSLTVYMQDKPILNFKIEP